jgi:hypothetical protein|tara:strand:- start:125 stop:451 length:327 start_codon:yes stop_codon:yes gene_type:complete
MIWPAFSVRMRSKADCSRLLPSQQHQCSELIGFTQNTETGDDDAKGTNSVSPTTSNRYSAMRYRTADRVSDWRSLIGGKIEHPLRFLLVVAAIFVTTVLGNESEQGLS